MPDDPRGHDPQALLPLKPVELLILAMLSAGDRHGYGIRQDIIAHTDGRIALEAGNLYRHIRNLEDAALLEAAETWPMSSDGDGRRIHYRLLPRGRKVLAAELARVNELARFVAAHRVSPRRA